jgi:integrase
VASDSPRPRQDREASYGTPLAVQAATSHGPPRSLRTFRGEEVRPLAPTAVEALRGVLSQRDAMIVSLIAYAGLRPGEVRTLR